MKFTVSRADLARALTDVGRVVESRTTIPILSNVLIRTNGQYVEFTGTDLDIMASARVAAEISEPGDITVDAARLSAIAKKAGADPVSFETRDGQLVVKTGRSRFTLPTISTADFPTLDAGTLETSFEADLAGLFALVRFAISTEETRYYLNGVYMHVDGIEMAAVATDGHRMARAVIDAPIAEMPPVIVPRKLVGILPKGKLHVQLSASKIRVSNDEITIVSKLIDGSFPDYKRIIPRDNDNHVAVNRQELLSAIERVSTVAENKTSAVKLNVTGNTIDIILTAASAGQATESVDCSIDGEPTEIGFNHRYLSEILGIMTAEDITLKLGNGTPALFTGQDNWLGLVMPMRV